MVSIFIARALGPSALGRFSLLFTILLTLVSMQTAWVGDALTVLDRQDPAVRRGVSTSQWLHVAAGVLIGGVSARFLAGVGTSTAVSFGILVGLWELEEFGRRVFMARLEFFHQAANDGLYLVVTGLAIVVMATLGAETLTSTVISMSVGSAAAFGAGVSWLPSDERLQAPSRTSLGLRQVSAYGGWRAMQSGTTFASQVITRSLVIALASAAVMGRIEAARLVVAPLVTLAGALSNVSLASIVRAVRANRSVRHLLYATAAACAAISTVYGTIVLSFPTFFVHLLAGHGFAPDTTALAGWLGLACVTCVATPFIALALVSRRIVVVCGWQVAGTGSGAAAAAAFIAAGHPSLMPACLAVGAAFAAVMLWRLGRDAASGKAALTND